MAKRLCTICGNYVSTLFWPSHQLEHAVRDPKRKS